ncbi:MAG TPA: hypothetical protein VJT72_05780 [Pseudonocardiaceae bacterium]|nr:hypothetical protein [Pseudonocardiaceae bacterium]
MTRQPTTGAVTDARPVTLVRSRPGVAGETARTVHLVPLPVESPVVTALCGALLRGEDIEPVAPGQGMPCTMCVLSHVADGPPPSPVTTSDTRVDTDPLVAMAGYRAGGWPVTLHRDQIRLNLDDDTGALIIPVLLAAEVTAILVTRRCPVPVLAHPYAPEHRILLMAERFGVTLPWPPGVHRVTGTLLLPPTVTPRGPITWTQLPEPDALQLCREIDVLAALRTALNDPSAPH